jgi:hypothetical protein
VDVPTSNVTPNREDVWHWPRSGLPFHAAAGHFGRDETVADMESLCNAAAKFVTKMVEDVLQIQPEGAFGR